MHACTRARAPVQEGHEVPKAEEHHDVHADPHAVEARGRPRVRTGVRDLAAGVWAVGGCGLTWGLALVRCHRLGCSFLFIPAPRTAGVVAHGQPDECAEGLEGKECEWKHAVAASARHGSQVGRCRELFVCDGARRRASARAGKMWLAWVVLGWVMIRRGGLVD